MYTSRVLAYWAKFGFWSIVSRKIKMLEKNAFLQQLLVRIYQKADRRCQIAQQSLKFLLWFKYSGLKACLCFKHFLIPKNSSNYYNDHSGGATNDQWTRSCLTKRTWVCLKWLSPGLNGDLLKPNYWHVFQWDFQWILRKEQHSFLPGKSTEQVISIN